MNLAALQSAFRAEIASEDDAPPSSPGMAIYRDAYRGRLLAALEHSFERTRRWVGEDAFTAAACHYILTSPPRSWTLDDYGADFPVLLAQLFAENAEVGELAWLEWQMQHAFAAPDAPTLDPGQLAVANYGEAEWNALCFNMAAGFATRAIDSNVEALWPALADGSAGDFVVTPTDGRHLVVWRETLNPRFRMLDAGEAAALCALANGAPLGTTATSTSPEQLGAWLSRWLAEGVFAEVRVGSVHHD